MGKVFFTADTLHGERLDGVVERRGFSSPQDMTEALIAAHNHTVSPGDQLIVLGNFCAHPHPDVSTDILSRMNGVKTLIKGELDFRVKLRAVEGWASVDKAMELRMFYDGAMHQVMLSAYPHMAWKDMHKGSYHLHGFCQGTLQQVHPLSHARMMDVGVDMAREVTGVYRPFQWEEIAELLSDRTAVAVDFRKKYLPNSALIFDKP